MALLNGKAEELSKYSKLKYVPKQFIEKAKEVWEYSDKQIRCIYLISDLAKKGNGVFSIAYSTFQRMFEQRFDLKISMSTVRRFFGLMEKLGLLSINEAKRKNNSQSANIYIVEQQGDKQCLSPSNEHPSEHPPEDLNIVSKETKDNKQKPLIKSVNSDVQQEKIIHDTYLEFSKQGVNKALFQKVLSQVQNKSDIKNFKAYLRGSLNNVIHHKSSNNGTKVFENPHMQMFYDYLHE